MNFYTNVIQRGNSLLVRGVEDGQRVSKRVNYEPTLFNKVTEDTGYKTLDGQHVLPKHFHSIKEAKAWVGLSMRYGSKESRSSETRLANLGLDWDGQPLPSTPWKLPAHLPWALMSMPP